MITVSERDDHLIVYQDGNILSKINDRYNKLKYLKYDGNRIFFKWSDNIEVQETYDDRIFNCKYNDKTIQVREANDIAKVIEDKDEIGYIVLFKEWYYVKHKNDIVAKLISDSFGDRVRITPDKKQFIVDERFMVDENATAHYKESQNASKLKWCFLCIVVQRLGFGEIKFNGIDLKLDRKMIEIIAKITFLLDSDTRGSADTVFMNQLPQWLSKIIRLEHDENKRGLI